MLSKKALLLALLSAAPLTTSCALNNDADLFTRIFGEPTEKNIVNVPHLPLSQLLDQEKALRRYRNPEELFNAIKLHLDTATSRAIRPAETPKSILTKTYVYRLGTEGISYVKLGSSELPVRVMNLPFVPENIYTKDDTLIVTGKSKNTGKTMIARINIEAPAAPKLENTIEIDGQLQGVRFAEKTVFFVLQGAFASPFSMPSLAIDGTARNYDYTSSGCACPALYGFTRTFTNPSFLHVLTLDLTQSSSAAAQHIIALNEDQQVLLGNSALYIAYKPQLRESDIRLEVLKNLMVTSLSPAKKLEYTKIVDAPDYILNAEEKREKQLMYLESQQRQLGSSAQQGMQQNIQIALDKQTADNRIKTDITMLHKLRFDTGKLQYVSAVNVPGQPLETALLGEHAAGTWFISKAKVESATGTLLHTLDDQMQPQGNLPLENILQPQIRRERGETLWLSNSGITDARIIDLSDSAKPAVVGTRSIASDARLITIDEQKSLQISKIEGGLGIALLDTSGEPKILASTDLKGAMAYSRLFDSLTGALYIPEQKMLILHVEETRRPGNAGAFDGVMVFSIGDNTIEKKAEFDLRRGVEGQFDAFDIQISQLSDKEVAVLYGKTASSIDLVTLQETSRKVLR